MTIIEQMQASSSELLKAEANDISKWQKLKHDKDGLELMLQFNVIHLSFVNEQKTQEDIICTGNTALIKIMSLKKQEDKKKYVSFKGSSLHSKYKDKVFVWDLKDNKLKLISLARWSIIEFVTVAPENILILDEIVRKLLRA